MKEYTLDQLGILCNGINYLVLKNRRKYYDVHKFIFYAKSKNEKPIYFEMLGQYDPPIGDPVSERVFGLVEQIDIIGIKYS